jgi:uncharacterized SAM-binding protein YcdF (DUF218 family)
MENILYFVLVLASPPSIFIIATAIGIILKNTYISAISLLILWTLSLPIVADGFWQKLENHTVRGTARYVPEVSNIVVLSGMTRIVQGESGHVRIWAEGSDRFWAGVELYKAGRAPVIVFTGGNMPQASETQNEGEWLRIKAINMGVPETSIIVTRSAKNTFEEAKAVSELLLEPDILLVTSAFHMQRAQSTFEARGFKVYQFPVDHRVISGPLTPIAYIPSAIALNQSSRGLRELLSRVIYAIRNRYQ